jgi:hypothetical protein
MPVLRSCWLLGAALVMTAAPAFAQARPPESLQDVLSVLIANQGVQTADFERDKAAAEATRDTMTRAFLLELANLPMASGSGGFTYRFNPSLGTVERASESFGPFFVERALTSGRGQASFGLAYQHATFTRLDGRSLGDGSLVTTANTLQGETAPFDVDRLTLRLQADTVTAAGSVGITDRLDVGAALPLVSLRLSGTRVNVYRGSIFSQAQVSATRLGVADASVRAKVRLVDAAAGSVAASTEVRLPTGSEENLLGAGRAGFRVTGIASFERGVAATHANVGLTRGGLSDEFNYSGAVGFAASPHATVVLEVIGRRVAELHALSAVTAAHPEFPRVSTVRLLPDSAPQSIVSVAAGFKWNAGGLWLVQAQVLVPLTQAGLTTPAMPSFAIDRAFTR